MPCSLPVLSPYLQCVIDAGAVEALFLLISEPKSQRDIVKEACWTLSNIAAGSLSQISAVLESGCVEHVVMLANDVRDHHTVTFVMRDEWGCGVIEVVVIGWVAIGCHWLPLVAIGNWNTLLPSFLMRCMYCIILSRQQTRRFEMRYDVMIQNNW